MVGKSGKQSTNSQQKEDKGAQTLIRYHYNYKHIYDFQRIRRFGLQGLHYLTIYKQQMSQRHYSPDQVVSSGRPSSQTSTKRLREGGSTSKMLTSSRLFIQDEIIIGQYKYRPSDEIGAGYSSRVFRGSHRNNPALEYAIKVIEMRRFSASSLEMLQNEIEILRQLSHPNVIKLYYIHRTQSYTYLVTELCKGGDLLEYMTRKCRVSEQTAAVIMSDVIDAVKYLMKMGVIHRDIKPANILRSDKAWKIADFGFSILKREEVKTKQNVGTPLYMPIESLLKNIYSPESDIFAVGVMYYQLLVGVTPWECRSEKELIKKLATQPFVVPQKYKLSSHIKFLLNKMCSVDKSTRMHQEEFFELNLKNFVSLHNFNDPMKGSQKTQRKGITAISPSGRIRRSKSKKKGNLNSKEKIAKVQKEYKLLPRKKKSLDKNEGSKKRSLQKDLFQTGKIYRNKTDEGSTIPSLLPESEAGLDRFEMINQKLLGSQLDFCRFTYYLIQNSIFIPVSESILQPLLMVLFKHLLKLIKQLADSKNNPFKLPNYEAFKQTNKWKSLTATFSSYCQKYQRDYFKYLKEANIAVIRGVNGRFSQLASKEVLSLAFYTKVQAMLVPALKQCLSRIQVGRDGDKAMMEGTRSLYHYYRWIELNVTNYENYVLQKGLGVTIVKNYKNSEMTSEMYQILAEQIKAL